MSGHPQGHVYPLLPGSGEPCYSLRNVQRTEHSDLSGPQGSRNWSSSWWKLDSCPPGP